MRSPEATARKLVTRIPHPTLGEIPNIASPIRYQRTPVVDPVPAPTIGQHTQEILHQVLGYSDERIAQLAQTGTFGEPAAPAITSPASA